MNAEPATTPRPSNRARNRRPTIGFLTPHIAGDGLGANVWNGVMNAAKEYDVNIICFIGGELRSHQEFQDQANVLYELANSGNVDGLILWGSTLRNFIGPEAFETFCARFGRLPFVELDGIPKSVAESHGYQGMYLAVLHLLETHKCRRVAFIPGASGNTETHYRYQAYVDALQAHNIPLDPRLVAPPDYWDEASGRQAVRILLDQRRVTFEAIAAANDRLAIGAIETLQEWGIRVPYDVAVVGFDNNPDGQYITPPLTTVPYPTDAMGLRAVKTLLRKIKAEAREAESNIQPSLVIRQSCGCVNPSVTRAGLEVVSHPPIPGGLQGIMAQKETLLTEMLRSLNNASLQEWVAQVVEAFLLELCQPSPPIFLSTLDDILGRVISMNGDVADWQNVISALRQQTLGFLADEEARVRAENLFGQARVLIGEVVRRYKGFRNLRAKQQMNTLRKITAKLISAFDVQELVATIASELPYLNIPSCYLTLYERPEAPMEWGRLLMAYQNGQVELLPDGVRFPASDIIPAQFWPETRRYIMVVESLYHQQDQLGFIVFESGPTDGGVYAILRDLLSSALQGALLVQQVQTHSAELARTNAELARKQYILDAFMENVPDAIYFKDRESRIIRANQAHARRVGLSEPADVVGKTDFDFFSEHEARLRYMQEQEIIRNGQPLIGFEEHRKWFDGHDSWSLVTKMPLRDEHDAIIGTFGISRDITTLKEAQASLERAYEEIRTLNNQLREENLRYYMKASLLSMPFETSLTDIRAMMKETWTAPWLSIVLFKLFFPNQHHKQNHCSAEKILTNLRCQYDEYAQNHALLGMFHQLTACEAALILNIHDPAHIAPLCAFLEAQGQAFIQACGVALVIGIGKEVTSLEDVHESYEVAQQALLARQNIWGAQILTERDAEQSKQEALLFWLPVEQENQLITAVTAGQQTAAAACLRRIFEKNALEQARYQKGSALYERCLRILSKVLAQHPLPEKIARNDELLQFFRAHKPEMLTELQERLLDIFKQVSGFYRQYHQQRADMLLQKLLRYFEQHYADSGLSLISLSEHFKLTPSYISEYFKDHTGLKYVEYLATLRIKKAKELMNADPELNIADICTRVGFANVETFIRTFKRLEGTSPGKYRKHTS
ncbi:PAS/PAC sensor hybrid histidine kinase [Candidatus Moduliflexus flocculans]|uniref:PAS/PAC sensor hybrid histidine kinase n=1 Tax=Candidatus Moduliflexus flocculans TaxID=1499966 RepID=A0A0S6VTA3_9BACT|nr:PAS/PAC sensor hybrid histidine kinase [Candidatus Moduliflexus flocculans]